MRTASAEQYNCVLESMTPREREALEELIDDILDREVKDTSPGALRALAAEYVRFGLSHSSERQGAIDIAAGLYVRAEHRLN
jgi:hypothetical protein